MGCTYDSVVIAQQRLLPNIINYSSHQSVCIDRFFRNPFLGDSIFWICTTYKKGINCHHFPHLTLPFYQLPTTLYMTMALCPGGAIVNTHATSSTVVSSNGSSASGFGVKCAICGSKRHQTRVSFI